MITANATSHPIQQLSNNGEQRDLMAEAFDKWEIFKARLHDTNTDKTTEKKPS